ncbi:chromate transporter [Alkalibacterium subtropicum]|uniref:Chromate transporter n=1 Tax=Alkalibacterium subtropicum TaxID=753702 RepID=A0A1I1L5G5_9LACT|nr:chromate efflux transporter [Alkalibacterium subtropicum]SFC66238.1 chromate transporter [Alkalibacterium subtropicum]
MNNSNTMAPSTSAFLKDIFICSLGAFGGPEAHYSVFTEQLVIKKKYLTEEDLVELMALCAFLPGPSSTQTIVAIGHKTGGPLLALLTMLVWALPALTIMTTLSFLYQFLNTQNISTDVLRFIGPMAVGFIILASYRIGKKVAFDRLTFVLLLFGGITTYFIRAAWIFPLVLLLGGLASLLITREKNLWSKVKLDPPYPYLALFLFFTFGSLLAAAFFQNELVSLFERFYRYGYLVFGGGQVVIPVMYTELVDVYSLMTSQQFLTGYGLVQGIPGPMFSFSAYAGGMAAQGGTFLHQITGAVAGGIGIFLPGLLLIYFVYPMWEKLKLIKGFRVALKGVAAVAGGLIAVAAVILTQQNGVSLENLIVTLVTVILLYTKKVPVPLIVAGVVLAGFIL